MRRRSVLLAITLVTGATFVAARAPLQSPPVPLTFIQLTDPQFGMYENNASFAQETANLEFAIATANRLRPAFVAVTGDLVNRAGDEAQTAEYRRIVAKLDPAVRLYNVAGNHDVENKPTPASLQAYTDRFGPDRYTFRHGDLVGVVINTCLIAAPEGAPVEARAQDEWIEGELAAARRSGARHIVVFLHHPLFTGDPDEADKYENLPLPRRTRLLGLFRGAGVRYVFAGHFHANTIVEGGGIEMVTTGPIGMPLRGAKSGMRVGIAGEAGIEHRYYELGELPNRIAPPGSGRSTAVTISSYRSVISVNRPDPGGAGVRLPLAADWR